MARWWLLLLSLVLRAADSQSGSIATTTSGPNVTLIPVYTVEGNTTIYVDDTDNLRQNLAGAKAGVSSGLMFLANIKDNKMIQLTVDGNTYLVKFVITVSNLDKAENMTLTLRGLSDDDFRNWRQVVNSQVTQSGATFKLTDETNFLASAMTTMVKPPDKSCPVTCCNNFLYKETQMFCKEFEEWKTDDSLCAFWAQRTQEVCRRSCGDCSQISNEALDQCTFHMNLQLENFAKARILCRQAQKSYDMRCKAVCNITEEFCTSAPGQQCSKDCANYQGCTTYAMRKSQGPDGFPEITVGKTVLRGEVPNGKGLKWSCLLMDDKCSSHKVTSCGPYKWCPVDLCILNGISCPPLDACRTTGVCEPSDGQCYYTSQPNGFECDDGIFYTLGTTCQNGKCMGFEDKCLRYNINCDTRNPCIYNPGGCDADNGHCVFYAKPDGSPCPTSPSLPRQDGRCLEGLCRRVNGSLCTGIVCPNLGPCYLASICEESFGACIAKQRPEGYNCSDGDNTTSNDRCIEGACYGIPLGKVPPYQELGVGLCVSKGTTPLPRYFLDHLNETHCQEQCTKDPLCDAFSYKFPLCQLFSARRSRAPDATYWARSFTFGHVLPAQGSPNITRYGVPASSKVVELTDAGDLPSICYRKGFRTIETSVVKDPALQVWLTVVLTIFCFTPILAMLLFFGLCRCSFCSRCVHRAKKMYATAFGPKEAKLGGFVLGARIQIERRIVSVAAAIGSAQEVALYPGDLGRVEKLDSTGDIRVTMDKDLSVHYWIVKSSLVKVKVLDIQFVACGAGLIQCDGEYIIQGRPQKSKDGLLRPTFQQLVGEFIVQWSEGFWQLARKFKGDNTVVYYQVETAAQLPPQIGWSCVFDGGDPAPELRPPKDLSVSDEIVPIEWHPDNGPSQDEVLEDAISEEPGDESPPVNREITPLALTPAPAMGEKTRDPRVPGMMPDDVAN